MTRAINNAGTDDIRYRMGIFDRNPPEWRSIYNDFHPTEVDVSDAEGCRTAKAAREFLERRFGKPLVVRPKVTRR